MSTKLPEKVVAATSYGKHFVDDVGRARAILDLAKRNDVKEDVKRDLRLSAIALAVGAMDAYFCDAYSDCLASVFQAANRNNPRLKEGVPEAYCRVELPAGALLAKTHAKRPLWAIRIAAKKYMDKRNMLEVDFFSSALNPILPKEKQLWRSAMPEIMKRTNKDLTGVESKRADSLGINELKAAIGKMKKELKKLVQLRHNWIHNCGRRRYAIEPYYSTDDRARHPIDWIEAVVCSVDAHLQDNRIVK